MQQGRGVRHATCPPAVAAALAAAWLALAAGGALAQTGRVAGTVKDDRGRPVKGATVVADSRTGAANTATAASDDRGRFSFVALQPAAWRFVASAPGFRQQTIQLEVVAGRTHRDLDFVLRRQGGAPTVGGAAITARELQGELDAAATLLDAGQYEAAIRAYTSILQRVPALTQVHLQLGNAYRALGDVDRALAEFGQVLKSDPGNQRARLGLGLASMDKGDLTAAEATLLPAASAPLPSRDVLAAMGDVKRAGRQMDAAAAWYEKAAASDPAWPAPLLRLAELAAARGDRTTAASLLEKAIALAPDAPTASEAKRLLETLKRESAS